MKKIKILSVVAKFCIILSVSVLLVRGYLGDTIFNTYKHFTVPAGRILSPQQTSFRFAVVSDTGSENHTLEQILKKIYRSDNRFVLYLGDLVVYRTASHFNWMTSEISQKIRNKPFYMVPGNHEIKNIEGEIDKKLYRSIFGHEYYWFSYGNTIFIGLDTSDGTLADEQLAWLANTLEKIRPQFENCIIFSHIPPVAINGQYDHSLYPASAKKLEDVLKGHQVDLLLFGHVHTFSKQEFAGIPLYTMPSSGQEIRSSVDKFGYAEVEVSAEGIKDVAVKYVNAEQSKEDVEILLTEHLLSNRIRILSLSLFSAGLLLLLLSQYIKERASFKHK